MASQPILAKCTHLDEFVKKELNILRQSKVFKTKAKSFEEFMTEFGKTEEFSLYAMVFRMYYCGCQCNNRYKCKSDEGVPDSDKTYGGKNGL